MSGKTVDWNDNTPYATEKQSAGQQDNDHNSGNCQYNKLGLISEANVKVYHALHAFRITDIHYSPDEIDHRLCKQVSSRALAPCIVLFAETLDADHALF